MEKKYTSIDGHNVQVSSTIQLFRVSKHPLKAGDSLLPLTSYNETLNGDEAKMAVEESLNRTNPRGDKRSEYLFLFCDLASAFLFLIKCCPNGYIYSVTVINDDIIYRCDMNLIDSMHHLAKAQSTPLLSDAMSIIAKKYWNLGKTFSPCYELLTKKAVVSHQVFHCEETEYRSLIDEYNKYGSIVLNMPTFKRLFVNYSIKED